MTNGKRQRCVLPALTALAALVFLTGIGWGLPSRAVDPYLFGSIRPWTGEEILRLAGDRHWDPTRGADVAVHPIEDRTHIVALNETDRQRAEIVRRYRLYSYQPDEMTTLMSLAGMRPSQGDFDPKLYQYGGLYIYPVGVALKVASKIGFVDLKSDVAYYLDHPEAFGKFYVVARFTVAAWGIAGVLVVFFLTQRLTGGLLAPAMAGLGYVLMPAVVNMAHEAKPHLPGAILMLLTVLAADRYVRSGRRREAILAGALAGAAMGMVVSAILAFSILPVMTLLRIASWRQRIATTLMAGSIGLLVYFATNPYVAINLVRNRAVLQSNLGNSTNMYSASGWTSGLTNAVGLLAEGASPGVLALGVTVVFVMVLRRRIPAGRHGLALMLAVPAGLQLIQFFALASGKPGEYGRFALFLDVVLLVAAITGISQLSHSRGRIVMAALIAGIGFFGGRYLIGFVRDCRPMTSRLVAASGIRGQLEGGVRSIAIWAEPAPYSLPPVDLFRCRLLLLPRDTSVDLGEAPADLMIPRADAMMFPVNVSVDRREQAMIPRRMLAPPAMSWADRRFCILRAGIPGSP